MSFLVMKKIAQVRQNLLSKDIAESLLKIFFKALLGFNYSTWIIYPKEK